MYIYVDTYTFIICAKRSACVRRDQHVRKETLILERDKEYVVSEETEPVSKETYMCRKRPAGRDRHVRKATSISRKRPICVKRDLHV